MVSREQAGFAIGPGPDLIDYYLGPQELDAVRRLNSDLTRDSTTPVNPQQQYGSHGYTELDLAVRDLLRTSNPSKAARPFHPLLILSGRSADQPRS